VVDVSGANEYSVKPLLLVSTVTPAIVAVFTVFAAAAAGLLLLEDEGAGEAPAELHATRAAAAAAAAGRARSIRRRARPPLVRRALPLPPRPGILRVIMTSCPLCRVSVPGWLGGVAGDDCLAATAGRASGIRRQRNAFSLEIDMLICSFFASFLLGNWRQRRTHKRC
jgi:hypothetical protein